MSPLGIGVATGEHAHNRMVFKQLLQANAIDVVQIDSCRLAGVSEVLAVLLMSAKCVFPFPLHSGAHCVHIGLASQFAPMQAESVFVNMSFT